MQTLESLIFLVKAAVKFRNLQISKILNTDTNKIFPIPFKVMYISLRYTKFEKQFAESRSGYVYRVNQKYSLANAFFPYKKYNQKLHAKYYDDK